MSFHKSKGWEVGFFLYNLDKGNIEPGKFDNKVKTTVAPSPTHQASTHDPPLTNIRGADPRSPVDPCLVYN